ncbi:Synaptotagmin-14 [Acropora cervicornis]|uniref:Synaptotagmin-14 n=1 Tax=Acropora cervicornis TaxID=6130 RepID=A0AAD9Q3V6_ACRCE|nr:Synaptotagmin-14 [Acropora cervicornis]
MHTADRAAKRYVNTYVKVAMFNSIGQQLSKSKTSIRRSMCDPEYNENFVFQIIEFELPSVSLMFSVVNIKKMRRKEIIGWFSMGRDNTGEDEEAHWKEMIEAKGQPRKRWHILSAEMYSQDGDVPWTRIKLSQYKTGDKLPEVCPFDVYDATHQQ